MHAVKLVAFVTVTTYLVFAIKRWRRKALRNSLPLPPGPRGLPLVGSLFDIDIAAPWTTYERWGKHFDGVSYCTLLGQEFVIVNDEEVAHELMVKRSSIYCGRPYLYFGLDFNSSFLPYGDEWRPHRKMFNVGFSKQKSKKYEAVQMKKAHQLLVNLLSTPLDYPKHFSPVSAAIIVAITYGYDVAPKDDPFVTNIVHLVELFIHALTAECAALINAIPLCLNILQAAGIAAPSLVGDLFEMDVGDDLAPSKEEAVKAVAATVFLGGVETTSSTLFVFLLAMVLYPEVQAKVLEFSAVEYTANFVLLED
ncbi:cytochrome P450 [Pisolithus marmoratus]|nr:cytochrome P450 [Pisolithus marmoratus]